MISLTIVPPEPLAISQPSRPVFRMTWILAVTQKRIYNTENPIVFLVALLICRLTCRVTPFFIPLPMVRPTLPNPSLTNLILLARFPSCGATAVPLDNNAAWPVAGMIWIGFCTIVAASYGSTMTSSTSGASEG
jgi:hypothetical protein